MAHSHTGRQAPQQLWWAVSMEVRDLVPTRRRAVRRPLAVVQVRVERAVAERLPDLAMAVLVRSHQSPEVQQGTAVAAAEQSEMQEAPVLEDKVAEVQAPQLPQITDRMVRTHMAAVVVAGKSKVGPEVPAWSSSGTSCRPSR